MTMQPPLPPIREIVEQYQLQAKKKFGQHFLFDLNLTEKIVRLSEVDQPDMVFEIGPGPGGLTRPLLKTGAKIQVIETDQRFLPHLQQLAHAYEDRLQIHQGDALEFDLAELCNGKSYRIVANLPYNIGTALLIKWLTETNILWKSLTLMFQLEVANRIIAKPGSKHYGRLSILCASIASCELVMQVPASVFTPPPKVSSAVVHITPLPASKRFDDIETLGHLTGLAFGQKRKMLRASLKPLETKLQQNISHWLQQMNIEPTARPETLTPNQFMQLADAYQAKT